MNEGSHAGITVGALVRSGIHEKWYPTEGALVQLRAAGERRILAAVRPAIEPLERRQILAFTPEGPAFAANAGITTGDQIAPDVADAAGNFTATPERGPALPTAE